MNAPWARADGVVLHIGLHKTGTTAIQHSLAAARPLLAERGIVYPGRAPAQHLAAAAVGQRKLGWGEHGLQGDIAGWERLVRDAAGHPGLTVMSSENFCEATDEGVVRTVRDLGRDRVQVVVTLRPIEVILVSSWQQYVKAGLQRPFDEWLRLTMAGKSASTPSFWRRNDIRTQLARWEREVGADDVLVIVLPPDDRGFVFAAFEQVLGMPSGSLVPAADTPVNRSLTLAEAEVLRRFNVAERDSMAFPDYQRLIRRGAALRLVEGRTPDPSEPRVTLPAWAMDAARARGAEDAAAIRAAGYPVLGDLDQLAKGGLEPGGAQSEPREVPIDAAVQLLLGLCEAALRPGTPAPAARSSLIARIRRLVKRRSP